MRTLRIRLFHLLVAAAAVGALNSNLRAEDAVPGQMTTEERAKAVKLLNDSEAKTLDLLKGLNEEQLHFKPATNRWSVLEVAEHIMLAESQIFGGVQKAVDGQPNPDWEAKTKGKTEFLETALLNRSYKAKAPETLVPSGKLSRDEVIAKFKEARARTLKFAEETQLPIKSYTHDHPAPVIGTLNGYQWLIFIPLHNERHNLQIEEVMADPNFPKAKND